MVERAHPHEKLRAAFALQLLESPLVFLSRRLMSDQLTPVLGYRKLVLPDERTAPSFLFESVENGVNLGRYSILGARPAKEVVVTQFEAQHTDHQSGAVTRSTQQDPLALLRTLLGDARPASEKARSALAMPACFIGGIVGFASFDSVRYLEPEKLPFSNAPLDDRALPDLHFGLYREVVVFDHVTKTVHAIVSADVREHASADAAFAKLVSSLESLVAQLEAVSPPLRAGAVDLDLAAKPAAAQSNMTRAEFEDAVVRAQEYIAAGDAFQVVLSQRFERETTADPFEIYRALRIVNPSPYQIYLQGERTILVASSPEILCRVRGRTVFNRPLAGTRARGATEEADRALERELLADEKECAEHTMLVDLGRNDLGRVSKTGSVSIDRCMEVERYSHVMHISSTLTSELRDELDSFDALRATLPVGTVSGAPKVRAIQIIDELEPVRRGPYAGGIGAVGFGGDMDIALALRTLVIPTADRTSHDTRPWNVYLQAGAGVVLDSNPASEWKETVDKSAALGRAIDLAEAAFTR
ncbi:MAG: anthranilate synthase component I [Phycisphaerales bacterium]|nr:anthranilate synthase component I [Phycisphaerales bacterium]